MPKKLTLPDGSTCQVIAPNRFSRMAAGHPPKSLIRDKQKIEDKEREYTPAELDWMVRSQKSLLVRCVSPIQLPDGACVRLVDKPFTDVLAGELSIEQLDDATLDLLLTEINALEKEVTAAAASFPANAQPQRPPDAGHSEPTVRSHAEFAPGSD